MERTEELKLSHFIPKETLEKLKPEHLYELKINIIAMMLDQRVQVFEDAYSESDGPWPPVQSHFDSLHRPLQDTGVLRNSFSNSGGGGESFRDEEVTDEEAIIRTRVEYAAIHNFGGTIEVPENDNGFGKGILIPAHSITIPRRRFDEFTEDQVLEIEELIGTYLHE